MNKMNSILLAMVLILAVILMFIHLNNKIDAVSEPFTTSNAAYNQAASFMTEPNYLMPTSYNEKNVQSAAAFLPDRYASRGNHPMNGLVVEKNKLNIPDSNSLTGYYPSVGFPPRSINSSKIVEGANVKMDKIAHTEEAPVVVQSNHVAEIDAAPAEQFSVNGRKGAAASRQFMIPSKNKEQAAIRSAFSKVPTKVGKI